MNPWESATSALRAPLVAVDLDAVDANADDLLRRAGGLPIRVASKSVRCRRLLDRVLARPGFEGVMAYAVPEAVWLASSGVRDVFVAYPSVDVEALRTLASDDDLRREVTITVDSVEHVRFLRDALGDDLAGVGVALDVDASLRVGPLHLGVRRSPTRTSDEALSVVRAAVGVGLDVRGVMFYDAQVAGLPDAGPHVRVLKRRSVQHLRERRRQVVSAVRGEVDLRFVNAGGTGSLHRFADDTVVTELAGCVTTRTPASRSPAPPPGLGSAWSGGESMTEQRERAPRMPPRWFVTTAWHVHRGIYRATRGRFGLWRPKPGRWGTLRLTTTGRRSGQPRGVILGYVEDGPNLVTLAMNGWADPEPAWWLNLLAHPDAEAVLATGSLRVRGRAAEGTERDRLWARWREIDAGLDAFAAKRSRETAVVVLEPVRPGTP